MTSTGQCKNAKRQHLCLKNSRIQGLSLSRLLADFLVYYDNHLQERKGNEVVDFLKDVH